MLCFRGSCLTLAASDNLPVRERLIMLGIVEHPLAALSFLLQLDYPGKVNEFTHASACRSG